MRCGARCVCEGSSAWGGGCVVDALFVLVSGCVAVVGRLPVVSWLDVGSSWHGLHGGSTTNLAENAEWLTMVAAVGQDERGVSDVVGGHLKLPSIQEYV